MRRSSLPGLCIAVAVFSTACKSAESEADADVTARLNALSQTQEEVVLLRQRLDALQVELDVARADLGAVQRTVAPLPDLVARASAIAEEWVDGTLIVRAGLETLGPLVTYYDTAVAFVDYDKRLIFAPLGGSGDVPFVGDLYFSATGCVGTPYVEHDTATPIGSRAAVLDRSSGLVYEHAGLDQDNVVAVRSRKGWRHEVCVDLPPATTVVGYQAKTRALANPGVDLTIAPRSELDL